MKKVLIVLIIALCAVLAFADESGSDGAVDPDLVGRWRWIGVTVVSESIDTGDNSTDYLITFKADGSFEVMADCRTGNGRYTADGSTLTMSLNNMTDTTCGANTFAPQLEQLLTDVANFKYTITAGNQLDMAFAAGTGTTQFLRINDAM